MFSIYVLEIPIPPVEMDKDVYKEFNLTATERAFIENIEN